MPPAKPKLDTSPVARSQTKAAPLVETKRTKAFTATEKRTSLTTRERQVADRVGELHDVDFVAMSAISNIYRVAGAIRNHMEREVLGPDGISWTGFTALFVLWVWGPQEARHLAAECNVTKGTMTGIMTTLIGKELITRSDHPDDKRLVQIALAPLGKSTIRRLFPIFNHHESLAAESLTKPEQEQLAQLLRKMLVHVDTI